MSTIEPDLSSRPHAMQCERLMRHPPHVIYQRWTTNALADWMADRPTLLMKAAVDEPFFFETTMDGQRHPHYGRFLQLEKDRLIEMTWVNQAGTGGAETVVRIELEPKGEGTLLRLSHRGFADQAAMQGHAEAWPEVLRILDETD